MSSDGMYYGVLVRARARGCCFVRSRVCYYSIICVECVFICCILPVNNLVCKWYRWCYHMGVCTGMCRRAHVRVCVAVTAGVSLVWK